LSVPRAIDPPPPSTSLAGGVAAVPANPVGMKTPRVLPLLLDVGCAAEQAAIANPRTIKLGPLQRVVMMPSKRSPSSCILVVVAQDSAPDSVRRRALTPKSAIER
jgi:hypothetical protein